MSTPVIVYLNDDQTEFVELAVGDTWHVRLPSEKVDFALTTVTILEASPRTVLLEGAQYRDRTRHVTREVKWVEKVGG